MGGLASQITINPKAVLAFMAYFARVVGFVFVAPFFSGQLFTPRIKMAFALMIAFMLYSLDDVWKLLSSYAGNKVFEPHFKVMKGIVMSHGIVKYVDVTWFNLGRVAMEFVVGWLFGVFVRIIFDAFMMAGELVDQQVGFGMMNIIDPLAQMNISILSNMFYLYATFIWVSVGNGVEKIMKYLIISVAFFPPMHFPNSLLKIPESFSLVLLGAIELALPFIAIIMLLNLVFAFMAKEMQGLNLFMFSFPIKLIFGLLMVYFGVEYLFHFANGFIDGWFEVLGVE